MLSFLIVASLRPLHFVDVITAENIQQLQRWPKAEDSCRYDHISWPMRTIIWAEAIQLSVLPFVDGSLNCESN